MNKELSPNAATAAAQVRNLQEVAEKIMADKGKAALLLKSLGYSEPGLVRDSQKAHIVPLGESDEQLAHDTALTANPRKKNWAHARAAADIKSFGMAVEDECFEYRGKYKGWRGYKYYPVMASRARISNDGAILTALINTSYHTIQAGRGYRWGVDDNGVRLVRLSDGSDYHPDSCDIAQGRKHILAALHERAATRKKQAAAAKRDAKILKNACKYGLWVCLQDSIAAGNCRAGTESFARKHGLDVRKHYRAEQLPQDTPESRRLALVILAAQRRQAADMARGYSEVSFYN